MQVNDETKRGEKRCSHGLAEGDDTTEMLDAELLVGAVMSVLTGTVY